MHGNRMGAVCGAAGWATVCVVGISSSLAPPHLTRMKQWAAVRTHRGLMRDPPHVCPVPIFLGSWMLTIQGQAPGWAPVPPTMCGML